MQSNTAFSGRGKAANVGFQTAFVKTDLQFTFQFTFHYQLSFTNCNWWFFDCGKYFDHNEVQYK